MHVMNTPQTTAGHRSSCHASLMCTQPWQGLGHDRDRWSVNSCWGKPLLGRWTGGVAPCCRSSPPCCKSGLALRGLHWQRQTHQIQSGTVLVCPLHSEDGALHGYSSPQECCGGRRGCWTAAGCFHRALPLPQWRAGWRSDLRLSLSLRSSRIRSRRCSPTCGRVL